MSKQSMTEVHPLVLLDTLTQTTSEELLVKSQSPLEILPRNGTEALARRRKGNLVYLGGASK
ncbi:hypothetical protein ACOSP7_006570 [Xanthoceras sorbifolium]